LSRDTPSLPDRLKAGTRAHHAAAERSGAMARLLEGTLERERYCTLLHALQVIYEALEAALDTHAEHPLLAPLRLPGLHRAPALALDLRALHGPRWQEELAVPAQARRYARRLRRLARWHPPLLAAHAYVRYLGDLHGGQLLHARVAKAFGRGAEASDGTAFYAFGDRTATMQLIQAFRAGLFEIGQRAPAQVERLVREAAGAFEQHQRLFEEVAPAGASVGAATGAPAGVATGVLAGA